MKKLSISNKKMFEITEVFSEHLKNDLRNLRSDKDEIILFSILIKEDQNLNKQNRGYYLEYYMQWFKKAVNMFFDDCLAHKESNWKTIDDQQFIEILGTKQ